MIKAFISKNAGGKTLCSIAECSAQENKKVAFITTEAPEKDILDRFRMFNPVTKKLLVVMSTSLANLYKKVETLSEDFDVICIDTPHIFPNLDLKKLNELCFGNAMNQCEELWITIQANRTIDLVDRAHASESKVIKNSEIKKILKIKQICESVNSEFIPGNRFIRANDLETQEVKTYNLTKIFKNN